MLNVWDVIIGEVQLLPFHLYVHVCTVRMNLYHVIYCRMTFHNAQCVFLLLHFYRRTPNTTERAVERILLEEFVFVLPADAK